MQDPVDFAFDSMRESDLDEVADIARQSFTSPWSRAMFENELLKNPFSDQILVRDGRRICGYLFMMVLFDECHLLDLAVHPEYRRKGVAKMMLRSLIETIGKKKISKIFLEVRISNRIAIALYEHFGFVQIATRKGYYTSPQEDAVILQSRLSGT